MRHKSLRSLQASSHPHACIIYDDLAAYRRVVSGYIREGLSANEKCIMAVDQYTRKMIETDFADMAQDFQSAIESKRLTLIDVQNSYSGKEGFDPDRTIKIWQEASARSVDEGYDALRVVGEATFCLGEPEQVEKLIYYENIINEILFPDFPFKSLCAYNKGLYSPEVIRAAISAHPILFYNDDLFCENIHYVPPQIHFNGNRTRDEADIWLANVKRNNENLIELRNSEQRYREIVEGTENLVTEVDANGRLTFVNEASLQIFGLPPDACIGRVAFDFIHEADRDDTLKKFERWMIEKPASATFENRQMNRGTGEARDMLWSINFVYDENKEIVSIKSIARDITQRKRMEQKLVESERRLNDAQKLVRIGYWFWDVETGEVNWSEEVFNLFGLDPSTFTPTIDSILELSPWPEDRKRDEDLMQRAIENHQPGEYEQRFMRPDGSIGYYLSTFQGIYDENCNLIAMRGTAQDITQRKLAEQELKKAHEDLETRVEERTKALLETVKILKSHNHEIELVNELGDLLQICMTEDESYETLSTICQKMWPVSMGFIGIYDKSIGLNSIETFWGESVQHADPFSPEECWAFRRGRCHSTLNHKTDLTCKHMVAASQPVAVCVPIAARGETLGVLSLQFPKTESAINPEKIQEKSNAVETMARRLTELFSLSLSNIRLRRDLYERSVRDSLTGLYNRSFMEESLGKELKIAEKKGTVVSIIMMDVDHFKKFNDTYGHETGDEVLRRLGIAIPSFLRPCDIICRYGGEEILIIMPDCPLETAGGRAEFIRSGIENNVKIRFGDQFLQVTASFGVAEFNRTYLSKEDFLSAADRALYLAKQAGRNTVQVALY